MLLEGATVVVVTVAQLLVETLLLLVLELFACREVMVLAMRGEVLVLLVAWCLLLRMGSLEAGADLLLIC